MQIKHPRAFATALLIMLTVAVARLGVRPTVAAPPAVDPPFAPSKLYLQNLDLANRMHARLKYYDGTTGQLRLEAAHVLSPGRGLVINQGAQLGLPADYVGNATVESNVPFGMVVLEANGNVGTLGRNFKMESYTGWSSMAPAQDLALPQLVKNIYDAGTGLTFNSTVVVQNTNRTAAATATLLLKSRAGQPYTRSGINVPAGGSVTIDLATDSVLSGVSSFYGSGHLTATQSVAVLHYGTSAVCMVINSGLSSAYAATTLYAPQLLRNVYDSLSNRTWTSSVQAITMDGTPANITLTFRSVDGTVYAESQAGVSLASFDLRYSSVLPSSFYGSGALTADKPIVAVVISMSDYNATLGLREATYSALPAARGGTQVFLPALQKNYLDPVTGVTSSTGVMARLAASSPTTVTLTYYLPDGSTTLQSASLSATTPMASFDQRYNATLPSGTTLAGILTTNPPVPIVAVVSFAANSSIYGDTSAYYEGIGE